MPPSSINWHKQKAPQEDGIKMHTFFLIIIIIFLFLLWSFLSLLVIYSQLEMGSREIAPSWSTSSPSLSGRYSTQRGSNDENWDSKKNHVYQGRRRRHHHLNNN